MDLRTLLDMAGLDGAEAPRVEVAGLSADSRSVKAGEVFLAVAGTRDDGSRYLEEAARKGAVLALGEAAASAKAAPLPVIRVPGLGAALPALARAFYGDPAAGLFTCGITGTNGKSTSAKLCGEILRAAGKPPAILGTIRYEVGDRVLPSQLTTPGPLELFGLLRAAADAGCRSLSMEVSSHALHQGRVQGLLFDRALFTNLTQDHLDYHQTFEDYFAAKRLLFTRHLKEGGLAVVNLDSPYGLRLAKELGERAFGFSRRGEARDGIAPRVFLHRSELGLSGTSVEVSHEGGIRAFRSRLIGDINVENLLGAIAFGFSCGFDAGTVARGIAEVTVEGRNEVFSLPGGGMAVVDYAHTPDALERVLRSLRPLTPGRLVCLFGCGGDRDRTKRPLMGGIAARIADRVIVTSDNPRTENPSFILDEIFSGIEDAPARAAKGSLHRLEDRAEAIAFGLSLIGNGDCLLIAGKGHEDYQVVGTEKRHFSDQEQIRGFIRNSSGSR